MEGEAGILEDGVEIATFDGRLIEAQERVRGEDHESEKRDRDHRLYGERAGLERRRQMAAEGGNRAAEQREDQDPEQQRALVVSPHAGDLVEQRLHRVRVLRHVDDREIRRDVAPGQAAEGEDDQGELCVRSGPGERHRALIAALRAEQRHHGLHAGRRQRQHQREMADLRDHVTCPCPSCPANGRSV